MRVAAVIARVEGSEAYLRIIQNGGGCGRCDEQGGCRSDTLGQMLGPRCREYAIDNTLRASVGCRVVVDVADGVPFRAALLAYLFPVLAMLVSAGLAQQIAGSDLITFVGAVAGLLLALAIVRSLRDTPSFVAMRPRLVQILTDL